MSGIPPAGGFTNQSGMATTRPTLVLSPVRNGDTRGGVWPHGLAKPQSRKGRLNHLAKSLFSGTYNDLIQPTTTKGMKMILREKEVQTLKEGEKIVFSRGGDTEQQMGTVRSIEVDGKYVTIWYYTESQELSLILSEKGETILITKRDRVMN